MNDAKSVIATVTKIAEILKEVQDLEDFKKSYVSLNAQQYDSTGKSSSRIYSQICIKRSSLGQSRSSLIRQVTS
jgi:hypothetical protein